MAKDCRNTLELITNREGNMERFSDFLRDKFGARITYRRSDGQTPVYFMRATFRTHLSLPEEEFTSILESLEPTGEFEFTVHSVNPDSGYDEIQLFTDGRWQQYRTI